MSARSHNAGRLVTVLLTIAAILVAGALVRAANTVEFTDRQLFEDAELDVPVELSEGGSVRITGVHVGANAAIDDGLLAPVGRWVLVEYEVSADTEVILSLDPQLRVGGDRLHDPVEEYDQRTPPGFTTTQAALFDVPPDALADMVFEIGPREVIHSHQQWIRWRIELSQADIDGRSADTVFPIRSVLRVTR